MSNEKEAVKPIQKIETIDAGKAVACKDGESIALREGVKSSAPANFALPDAVKMPRPVAAASAEKPTVSPENSKKE